MTIIRSTATFLRNGARATWSLLWMFVVTFGLAVGLTLLVEKVFGDFDHFKAWQDAHFTSLLLWRLLVYGVLTCGWINLRRHLLKNNESNRLIRCEVLFVLLICIFEVNHAGLLSGGVHHDIAHQ